MSDRKKMSVEEFDLLVRAIYRAYVQNFKCVTVRGSDLLYEIDKEKAVEIYLGGSFTWITLGNIKYEVEELGFFQFKKRETFRQATALVKEMRSSKVPDVATEQAICECVPTAKDIIAEKALVDDHGN